MARYYVSITLLLYLLALCFDAVKLAGGSSLAALQVLLYGPWGMAFGLFGWFANPLLGLALLLRRRLRWLSLLLGLWALYLACASWSLQRLPDNRSYAFQEVTALGVGYHLWVLALLAFCVGQAWCCRQARRGMELPRWHLLDAALAALLATTVVLASQDADLHFQVERALDTPHVWQAERPKDAI